ncbi:hypothetical protein [Vibrio crassostreae]|uniref:hypothetical protein n=1 Tax=Vibrio crassostreae TaxID=246167 RepID=UPI001B30FE5C|nr:hypothetical protein [Vibrio crassostreae]
MKTVQKSTVWHIGTLNSALRNLGGYEGRGLSVSECPEDWRRICKLGGYPLHELSNKQGRFADFYSMDLEKLHSWAVDQELAQEVEIFRVMSICGETEEEYFFEFESYEKALGELEGNGEEELADELITKAKTFKATNKMNDLFGHEVSLGLTSEYLFNLFVAEKHPECDGIWYEHENDGYYSAPAGIIFDHKLSAWAHAEVG